MKNILKNWFILATIFMIFINSNPVFAASELPKELQQRLDELTSGIIEIELCKEILGEAYDIHTLKFMMFLEENFQNKSSNTSLSNIAIAAFSDYKQNLESIFANLVPVATSGSQDIGEYQRNFEKYEQCSEMTESYIEIVKDEMFKHIKKNTAQKKTTIFIEKYHSINEKLRELNMEIAEMYSFFVTFKNKLPFFLQECQ